MNASTMAFVTKEDPEGKHSSLKIFLTTILTHTFSTREPKRLLVPRVKKPSRVSLDYEFAILLYYFSNLCVHFVKFL